jgi:hypothetical protein
MTDGWWERHMIMGEKQNQATRHADVINISRSRVFSSFRKESFAPPGDICVYIHLLGVYTYTLTTNSFAFTLPWMKSITARLSAKFRQALPTNNLCTLYTTFQNPIWEPAILNQTVMHNCYKHFWNSWICMHAALFLPASSPCIALSKQVSKHTVYGVLLLNYYWCCP